MALFAPYRALGYITDDPPFAIQRRGKETYATVSVGKSWQVYNTSKLTLVLVGPQFPREITAIESKGDRTFAATAGGSVIECQRVHRSGVYEGHTADVLLLLAIGDHLLSLSADRKLILWNIGQYDQPAVSITLDFTPTCMAHPPTYLNKVVVGGMDGRLQLWNFTNGKLVHEFSNLASDIRCIEPSPALDVVGLGLSDGRAILLNLKYDEVVLELANASGAGTASLFYLSGTAAATTARGGGACTSISFRSGVGTPLMAAGGGAGAVTVWDLEKRKLATVIHNAHDGPLTRLYFFPGEPLLMSAARDNSMKQWIFDTTDGSARLLKFRSGHSAPPAVVRYYADGRRLLSAGQDRAFRVFSTIQDQQSRELSQKHVAKRAKRLRVEETELKLARIVALDACEVRERDWANVITAHEGDCAAYVWRLQHFTLGEHILRPPSTPSSLAVAAPITAVCLSRCGNFGFVASASGRLDRYNMQSGIHRGAYQRPSSLTSAPISAHDGAIYGVTSDSCNRYVVSGGYDGILRIWDFKKFGLKGEIAVKVPMSKLTHHATTGLVAVACDDLTIRVYDAEALRLVRRFKGHSDRITDIQLSEDCRWLLSSSMDNTVRVWDVPGARVFQVMKLGTPVTSLSLSPAMDLLATAHVEHKGVYLWSNQMLFGSGADLAPSETPINVWLPRVTRGDKDDESDLIGDNDDFSTDEDVEGQAAVEEVPTLGNEHGTERTLEHAQYRTLDKAGAPLPLVPELVTLSLLPEAQWKTLIHIDTIKARNKPLEPPKKPEIAPFFLPTVTGANAGKNPVFALNQEDQGHDQFFSSRVIRLDDHRDDVPELSKLLRSCEDAGDWTSVMAFLRGLSPVKLDAQVRALESLTGDEEITVANLDLFLRFLEGEIASNRSFEFVQAILRATLAMHGENISNTPALKGKAVSLKQQIDASWGKLDNLLQDVRCMIGLLGNIQA